MKQTKTNANSALRSFASRTRRHRFIFLITFILFMFSACSDDDLLNSEEGNDGVKEEARWPFINHEFRYQYKLQNTSTYVDYIFRFVNNDSVYFEVRLASSGEFQSCRGGHYSISDGQEIVFSGLENIPIYLKGRFISLYYGTFNNTYSILKVKQRTDFNTGNSNSGYADYELVQH